MVAHHEWKTPLRTVHANLEIIYTIDRLSTSVYATTYTCMEDRPGAHVVISSLLTSVPTAKSIESHLPKQSIDSQHEGASQSLPPSLAHSTLLSRLCWRGSCKHARTKHVHMYTSRCMFLSIQIHTFRRTVQSRRGQSEHQKYGKSSWRFGFYKQRSTDAFSVPQCIYRIRCRSPFRFSLLSPEDKTCLPHHTDL